MADSTHKVEVVPLKLEKHPNADTLSIVKVGNYTVVTGTQQWDGIDRAAFILPDGLVDTTRPEFSFLAADAKFDENSEKVPDGKYARIKAKRLRTVVSYGLLAPLPANMAETPLGTDVSKELGVLHFEPPVEVVRGPSVLKGLTMGGEVSSGPPVVASKYDVEAFVAYGTEVFTEGEPVYLTEKIHGANARYVYCDGKQFCGSRDQWKREYVEKPNVTLEQLVERTGDAEKAQKVFDKWVTNFNPKINMWWDVFRRTPSLEKFCQDNPGYIVYGEVYGGVGGFPYNTKGKPEFVAFDIRYNGNFLDVEDFLNLCSKYSIPAVPIIDKAYPFNFDKLVTMADGMKTILGGGSHIAEGIVIKSLKERYNQHGRACLKVINVDYYNK